MDKKKIWLETAKSINAILMMLPFRDAWYGFYSSIIVSPFYRRGNWLILALFLTLYITFSRIYDAFAISRHRISEMVYSQSLSAFLSDFFLYFVIVLLAKRICSPLYLLSCFFAQILFSVCWSLIAQKFYFLLFAAKRSAIVYDMRRDLSEQIRSSWMDKKYNIQVNLHVDDCIGNLDILADMQTVFLSGVHSHDRNIILKYCVERNIEVFVIPRVGDVIMDSAKQMNMLHLPILRVNRYSPSTIYLVVKRAFDLFASTLALVVLSPIFLATAVAIKATDGGPVFYKQTRLTKDGKLFKVIKFRSMRVDAEKDGVARLSTGSADDRITPVGKIIRKLRVDELPQLINIFMGDMTICGPRPERPEIAEQYLEELPEFNLRLPAKAGLTGLAQVFGKYNTTPYDKLLMDLAYIANPSVLQDLRIMFATVKILFMPESTEGVAVGATTAMDYENAIDSTENDTETVAK